MRRLRRYRLHLLRRWRGPNPWLMLGKDPLPEIEPLPVEIREITWEQIDRRVSRCMAKAWRGVPAPFGWYTHFAPRIAAQQRARFRRLPDPLLLIAVHQEEIVGFRFGHALQQPWPDERVFYNAHTGVLPQYRDRWVASKLLLEQHRIVEERGYDAVVIDAPWRCNAYYCLHVRHHYRMIDGGTARHFGGAYLRLRMGFRDLPSLHHSFPGETEVPPTIDPDDPLLIPVPVRLSRMLPDVGPIPGTCRAGRPASRFGRRHMHGKY